MLTHSTCSPRTGGLPPSLARSPTRPQPYAAAPLLSPLRPPRLHAVRRCALALPQRRRPDPRGTPPPPPPRPPNGIGRARAARSSPLLLPPTSEGLLRPLQPPASAAPTRPSRLPLPCSATGSCSPSTAVSKDPEELGSRPRPLRRPRPRPLRRPGTSPPSSFLPLSTVPHSLPPLDRGSVGHLTG